jgi:hypothetical protein
MEKKKKRVVSTLVIVYNQIKITPACKNNHITRFSVAKYFFIKFSQSARHQWLMSVILATWEA